MKLLTILALVLCAASIYAASDADVTLINAEKVIIETNMITIIAEAKTRITVIHGDYHRDYKGDAWQGRPVSRVHVKSDKATFIIKRPREGGLDPGWQMSLKAARDLQEGKQVGRIGYYAPDIVIKDNLIHSITGFGFLYDKGQ